MASPTVFLGRDPRGHPRLFWLENGELWHWHRKLWKWWRIPSPKPHHLGGTVVPADGVLEIAAERGTPYRPRVDAGGPCLRCQRPTGELRVHIGTVGPFCNEACRMSWLAFEPRFPRAIDRRAIRH
ncbi:MAG: hypothetical protein SFW67_28480 [Myxococcaceae bacterium]|nr:hypothetical protein [Myxococcaceae bacterium]